MFLQCIYIKSFRYVHVSSSSLCSSFYVGIQNLKIQNMRVLVVCCKARHVAAISSSATTARRRRTLSSTRTTSKSRTTTPKITDCSLPTVRVAEVFDDRGQLVYVLLLINILKCRHRCVCSQTKLKRC